MKKDGLQKPAKEDNVSEREIQTVRELLDTAARDYGNRTFIKFADGDNIIEKSYITLRDNSYAISRYIRSFSQERMHIAIIGKTNYEYLTCLTGILISANVSVPFAPDIWWKRPATCLNAPILTCCSMRTILSRAPKR